MYRRDHHRIIADILQSMNSATLQKNECYFGTAIALLLNEYRESVDIDFLCSSKEGYLNIRALVSADGFNALFSKPVSILREAKIDRYGIRGVVKAGDTLIKFEIISERHLSLDNNGPLIAGVKALSRVDMFASKMLANADRYEDKAIFSRDIIDIQAMRGRWGDIPEKAKQKVYASYGKSSIDSSLSKAVEMLENNPEYASKCAIVLDIQPIDAEVIIPGYSKSSKSGK